MRRYWIHISIFAVVVTVLLVYVLNVYQSWVSNEIISRGQIARMLALMREDLPEDADDGEWYEKYVNVVLEEGWMNLEADGEFHPSKPLTCGELKYIMEQFHLSEESLSFSLKYRQDDSRISKKQWCEVYQLLSVDNSRISREPLVILGTPSNRTELGAWQILTDKGIKYADGLAVDACLNQTIEAYTAGDELLCIIRVMDSEAITETASELTKASNEVSEVNTDVTEEPSIRVLLHGNDGGYSQTEVTVTSEEAFYVIVGDEIHRYAGGEEITLYAGDGSAVIKTEDERGKIQILSLERSCGAPSYHGEICLEDDGTSLIVVNQVGIEDYVAGVIPGEMPVSYGDEALKAQAVCSRTFALRALGTSFQDYPANLDDTVASQVYNNLEECEESIRAASETKGQLLKNSDGLTPVYFFSTSCGHTSDAKDVWYDGSSSDETEAVSVFLSDDTVRLNLTEEEDFRQFINETDGITYFEQDLPFFRWQVFISAEDIQTHVFQLSQIDIGTLEGIEVVERAESGLLKAIRIYGSEDTFTVYGEYNIRQIFSPENAELILQNGETETGRTLLPSAYCYMDALVEDGLCEGYLIRGGGCGHGCGMSQNGAMKMAELGKTYEEILTCFFPDSSVVSE